MKTADFVELLPDLLGRANRLCHPPISNFRVGCALLGGSGRVYLGFNVEFPGQALHHTVHAEQCALSLAHTHGEPSLVAIAITTPPCGHCRQFLNEVWDNGKMLVYLDGDPLTLAELLPRSFGPGDLNIPYGLLNSPPWKLDLHTDDPLVLEALQSARRSYAPYSHCAAGVALETADGRIFEGSYAENAAFNPSFAPLQASICHLLSEGAAMDHVTRAVLVQKPGTASLEPSTRTLLAGLFPQARFDYHECCEGSP